MIPGSPIRACALMIGLAFLLSIGGEAVCECHCHAAPGAGNTPSESSHDGHGAEGSEDVGVCVCLGSCQIAAAPAVPAGSGPVSFAAEIFHRAVPRVGDAPAPTRLVHPFLPFALGPPAA